MQSIHPPLNHYFAMETWRPVPKTGGLYEASSLGRIRSWRIPGSHSNNRAAVPRISALKKHKRNGYWDVWISYEDRSTNTPRVHRLVLESFIGLRPHGWHCAHLNGDQNDNRLENIMWVTAKENAGHRAIHGTQAEGETCGKTIYSTAEVEAVRALLAKGETMRSIARASGMSRTNVRDIKIGRIRRNG